MLTRRGAGRDEVVAAARHARPAFSFCSAQSFLLLLLFGIASNERLGAVIDSAAPGRAVYCLAYWPSTSFGAPGEFLLKAFPFDVQPFKLDVRCFMARTFA